MRSISPSWVSTRSSSERFQSFSCSVCSCSLSACSRTVECAVSSSRLLVSTSENSRALRIASTDWWAKVFISPIRFCENSPAVLRSTTSEPSTPCWSTSGTTSTEWKPAASAPSRKRMVRRGIEIGQRDRLALRGGFAERAAVAPRSRDGCLRPILSMPIASVRLKRCLIGVIAIDQHGVGMGDFERARGDRRQHGVEVERGGDRAADLLEHLQLVDRLREVARALLHLAFEAGIGLGQLAGHAVELARPVLPARPRSSPRCGGRNRRRRGGGRRREVR